MQVKLTSNSFHLVSKHVSSQWTRVVTVTDAGVQKI